MWLGSKVGTLRLFIVKALELADEEDGEGAAVVVLVAVAATTVREAAAPAATPNVAPGVCELPPPDRDDMTWPFWMSPACFCAFSASWRVRSWPSGERLGLLITGPTFGEPS